MTTNQNRAPYATTFKSWQKSWGPQPTEAQLAAVHGLQARPGKQALAIAMGLRDCGVTNSQIVGACGNPQLNKMRGLISDAYLKRELVPNNELGHTVYKLHVTKKGEGRIARTVANAVKAEAAGNATEAPAKAKAPAKRKVKAPAS